MSAAVGRRTQIDSASPVTAGASPSASEPVPGKQPLIPAVMPATTHDIAMPTASVTGDALADQSTPAGLPSEGPDAFLEPAQRAKLVTDGQMRWLAVEMRMHQALASVSLREAIRPDDPPGFLVGILITAASVATMMGAGFVIDAARERGAELLEKTLVKPVFRDKALMSLARTSPKAIDAALEIGLDAGAENTHRTIDSADGGVADTRKDTVLEVLDGFHQQIAVRLQAVREGVPAAAVAAGDDAQLLAWFQLADGKGPLTFEHYRLLFAEKISRFLQAGLQHVGVDRVPLGTDTYTERLQWRRLNGKRRLAVIETVTAIGCKVDMNEVTFQRWVPEEFEESAVELSEARGVEVTSLGDAEEHVECVPDVYATEGLVPL